MARTGHCRTRSKQWAMRIRHLGDRSRWRHNREKEYRRGHMETTKKIATITLIILLGDIAYELFRTGRSTTASQTTPGSASSQAAQGSAIDQTPLDTDRRLVQMPTSADELPSAEEALRLG